MTSSPGTIAVIRRDARDTPHLLAWIRAAGGEPIDVCEWRDVHLVRLSSHGECDTRLAGIDLERFDAVLLVGVPACATAAALPQRERWFRHAERSAALLAALCGARSPVLINRGDALSWGRQLADPLTTLRQLSRCGWRTPRLETRHAMHDDPAAPRTSLPPPGRGTGPDDGITSRRLAIFTRRGEPFMVDEPARHAPADIRAMTRPMQALLDSLDLDWVTVAVGRIDDRLHAFGMRSRLPRGLGAAGFARVAATLDCGVSRRSPPEVSCASC